MEEYEPRILILVSQEGEKVEISEKAAIRSKLIKNMLEINPNSIEIPLNIKINILKKIKDYLEHYENEDPKEIERPLPTADLKMCVDEWDYYFIDLDLGTIFDIIIAGNYMDIKELLELGSSKIASIIKAKNTEEIKQIFNITNDFTPEEEQQILEENKWCMENL